MNLENAGGRGCDVFNRLVREQVRSLRAEALVETGRTNEHPFPWQLVEKLLRTTSAARRSLHLPRAGAKDADYTSRDVGDLELSRGLMPNCNQLGKRDCAFT